MSIRTATGLLALAALAISAAPAGASAGPNGDALFTMTNAASGNRVLVFAAGPGDHVHKVASVATGGHGSGANLGSEGSIALSPDHGRLYAVNAGSGSLSVPGSARHACMERARCQLRRR